MNSFYGGKQGLTYNIVQRFDSVQHMVAAFNQGGAYTKVNYGQYVIVDTISTNRDYVNKENGLLFRRGFDYVKEYVSYPVEGQQDTTENWKAWLENGVGGGAIYVGQISGPMGLSPKIYLDSYSDLGENASTVEYTDIFTPATTEALSDQFKIGYLNSTASFDDGSIQRVSTIGLQIPYPNINISAVPVNAYDSSEVYHNGIPWIPSGDNYIHKSSDSNKLYQDLQIAIPKGKKGDSLTNFYVKNIISGPNTARFSLVSEITNYDQSEVGKANTDIYDIALESQSVESLKLIGDCLYFNTHFNTDFGQAIFEQGRYWNPLGSPGGQFHIYQQFVDPDPEENPDGLPSRQGALNLLYATYPFGIEKDYSQSVVEERREKAGWVVAIKYQIVIEEEEEEDPVIETITELYAYDYNMPINTTNPADRWFKVADFSSMMITPNSVVLLSPRASTINIKPSEDDSNLAINGLWFLQQDLVSAADNWSILNKI